MCTWSSVCHRLWSVRSRASESLSQHILQQYYPTVSAGHVTALAKACAIVHSSGHRHHEFFVVVEDDPQPRIHVVMIYTGHPVPTSSSYGDVSLDNINLFEVSQFPGVLSKSAAKPAAYSILQIEMAVFDICDAALTKCGEVGTTVANPDTVAHVSVHDHTGVLRHFGLRATIAASHLPEQSSRHYVTRIAANSS